MKKKISFLIVAVLVLIFFGFGCERDEEDILAPSNLILEYATNGKDLILTWTASGTADIDGYYIYFNDVKIDLVVDTVTTYTHVDPDTVGEYKVTAYRGNNESAGATAFSATYLFAPSDLTLEYAANGKDLVLTWTASKTVDIEGYYIYFNGGQIGNVAATVTTFTHVDPDTVGEYKVTAYRGEDESTGATANFVPYIIAPSALILEGATNQDDLVLTWTASRTPDIDGYYIYFNDGEIGDIATTFTTFTHINPATVGEYKVTAYRGSDESAGPTASDVPYEGIGELWDMDTPEIIFYSGWGWNWSTGTGFSYSVIEANKNNIEFYYDSDNTLTSGRDLPWGVNETGFLRIASYTNAGNVPTIGYMNYELVDEGQAYALIALKTYSTTWHYIKLRIDSYSSTPHDRIAFTYAFQLVPKFTLLD